jgi:N-acetylneuraminic acid mutarotase
MRSHGSAGLRSLLVVVAAVAACEEPTYTGPTVTESAAPKFATATALASNTWAVKASIPLARRSAVAGIINNVIYVVGGFDAAGTPTTTVQAYNIATNTWSSRAPLPTAKAYFNGASAINGRLYLSGGAGPGLSSNIQVSRKLLVYNPQTNTWTRRADIPVRGGACGAQGVINGFLYVYVGGQLCGDGGRDARFYRYDPATNLWSSLAPPPGPDHSLPSAAGVINGKFYLAGGSDAAANDNLTLQVYTPATNSWTTRAPLPSGQVAAAGGVLNGKLYAAGGIGPLKTLRVYNPSTNTWSTKTPMPTARSVAAGVSANGLFWVISGLQSNAGTLTTRVEAYTP